MTLLLRKEDLCEMIIIALWSRVSENLVITEITVLNSKATGDDLSPEKSIYDLTSWKRGSL